MEGTPTIKSHRKLLQIIDTTLLQCYLHVSPRQAGLYLPQSQEARHHATWRLYFVPAYVSVNAHEARCFLLCHQSERWGKRQSFHGSWQQNKELSSSQMDEMLMDS